MASLHFILTAPVIAREGKRELGRNVALEVEVEGSAGIKSRAELVRAARAIAAEQLASSSVSGGEDLGEFTVAETREIPKHQQSPLTSRDWPGVVIWGVSAEPRIAA